MNQSHPAPAAPTAAAIPVICDRCRATGIAGEGDFDHLGDLLDFTPVPRKIKRADGWTPERQRAFIAALSATGSKRQAAQAVGMAAFGIDQMLAADGNDSFKAAYDRALAIAAQNGSMKIAQGVADAAARNAQMTPPSRLRGLPAPVEEDETAMSEDAQLELLDSLAGKFMRKVAQEREARLGGEIVAADFYVRQITMLELLLELSCEHYGEDAREVLHHLRRGRHGVLQIAGTEFTDWLDQSRRDWWAKSGEPNRPPHPDPRFLVWHKSKHGAFVTNVDQAGTGALSTPARGYSAKEWEKLSHDQQWAAREKQFAQDAEAQKQWEASAHADWQARKSGTSPSRSNGEGDHVKHPRGPT